MYRELFSVLGRKGINKTELSKLTGIKYTTLLDKLSGRRKFLYDECVLIKSLLKVDMPLEVLFKKTL